jgi:predicted Zn finger-like uncharacterized protein
MDVRCERCRAQYAVDDARVSEAGIKVACAQCGHAFLLRKKTLAVTVPLKGGDPDAPIPIGDLAGAPPPSAAVAEAAERGEWRLRQPGGATFPFRELSTLQRWIVERKATRDDEVAAAGQGDAWRRLGDVPELQVFFALMEKAQRRREARPDGAAEAAPEPVRNQPGLEDPAWARGPASPTRRVTRSALRPPPPRKRMLWVALIAVALLGVAAATVYLVGKAESDAKDKARNAEAAAQALAAAQASAAPAPRAEPPREPAPPPAAAPAPDPAPPVTVQAEQAPTGPTGADPAAAAASGDAGPTAAPAVDGVPVPAPATVAPAPKGSPRDDAGAAVRGLLARAREQRDRGRPESALDLYGQALAQDGRNATALAGRGACYLDLSRYDQAEASFGECLEVDPRNAEALFGLAETNRYMGRKDQAVALYERFLSVRPTGDDAAAARRLISQLKE